MADALTRLRGHDDYQRVRTARTERRCDHRIACRGDGIKAGEKYTESITFPGSDANPDGPAPWRARSCQRCIPIAADRGDIGPNQIPVSPSGNADFPAPPPLTSTHVPDLH